MTDDTHAPHEIAAAVTEPTENTELIENTTSSTPIKKPRRQDDEETQQFIETVATWLQETDETALWHLRKVVRRAGAEQTMALLKEVLAIEDAGGMMVGDGTRRRTLGGIFFYLAKGKGYLPRYQKPTAVRTLDTTDTTAPQPTGTTTGTPETAISTASWRWQDRVREIADLQHAQGAITVKMTLIGRPGRIANHGTFILTTMQSSKVPSLPKGLPVPAQASTTYSVYIASKQWKKVEESLRNPEDVLIAEGYPMLDTKTGTIAVFVSSTATKLLQAAAREQQKAATQG